MCTIKYLQINGKIDKLQDYMLRSYLNSLLDFRRLVFGASEGIYIN